MNNLELNNEINNLNNSLTNLSVILLNCSILLYQNVVQKSITYAPFDNATVNYNYTPQNLQYSLFFGINQIQEVITYYVNQANTVLTNIQNIGLSSQMSAKINEVNNSISQLDTFATALYNGQQSQLKSYTVPYNMSIRSALLLNGLTTNNIQLIQLYNSLDSVNWIPVGTVLLLL